MTIERQAWPAQRTLQLAYPSGEGWLLGGWAALWGGLGAGARLLEPAGAARWGLALLAGHLLLGILWATLRAFLTTRTSWTGRGLVLLPYSRPGSPAYRLGLGLARGLDLGSEDWLARRSPTLVALLTLGLAVLAAGWWLGPFSLALSAVALASSLASGTAGPTAVRYGQAAVIVGWPWLLALTAFVAPRGLPGQGETVWLAGSMVALLASLLLANLEGPRSSWGFAALVALTLPLQQPLASGAMGLAWLVALLYNRPRAGTALRVGKLVTLAVALAVAGLALSRL